MNQGIGLIAAIVACLTATACLRPAGDVVPDRVPSRYVFYLHGAIVESLGPRGYSERYGAYDLPGILEALAGDGVKVIGERRPKETDPSQYADGLTIRIRQLVESGVSPGQITVIGASKGAVIAALVSTRARIPGLNYVLLGNCNDWLIRTYDPRLTGRILSIYESSDEIGQSCRKLVDRSPSIERFDEVRLTTGLGHGFLYRPLPEWIGPASAWAHGRD